MRLTLRTLLAYLDDTLEPAQAKLIGQKVAESDAAQELIARIKQVTRRRRLTTPPNTGPGGKLDANVMAEYLDNMLPADQLAEVEETCLASDVHLAEAAACHQILTLVLGEPVLVPPTARQRMYSLIRGRESIPNRKAAAPALGPVAPEAAHHPNDEADEALLLGLPLYRQGSLYRWLVPAGAVALLIAGVSAIWMGFWTSTNAASREPVSNEVAAAPVVEREPEPLPPSQPEAEATPPKPQPSPEKSPTVQSQPDKPAAVAKGPSTPSTPPPEPADTGKKTENPVEKTEPSVAATPNRPPAPTPPSVVRRELGKAILTPPCILLQQNGDAPGWQRLSPEKRVSSTDRLVSLPGYRSDIRMDSGVQIQLWGNLQQFSRTLTGVLESAVTLYANPEVDLDFLLDHGRVLLTNHKDNGPARIRIRFHQEIWDLTLADQESEVAIELFGQCQPYTREPGGSEPYLRVFLFALKGQAQLRIRYELHTLFSPSIIVWDNASGVAPQPQSLPRAPDWWTSKAPPQNRVVQELQAALKELSQRLIAKDKIDVVVAEAMRDPTSASSRILAVRCLAAMNDVGKLVDALAEPGHVEVRVVAIEELRHLLGLSSSYETIISSALKQKRYTEGQAQTILQLLHGFGPEQQADPATRATAVEYLNHDKLAIRQLTHTLLCSFIPEGQKIQYDPAGGPEQLERGTRDWQKLIQGGKKDEGRGTKNGKGASRGQ